jgi:hypothetical protein
MADPRTNRLIIGACAATMMIVAACVPRKERSSALAQPVALDRLVDFADPKACVPGPILDHLLKTLLRDTTERPVAYGPVQVPPEFAGALGKPLLRHEGTRYVATVPVNGTWLGLPLAAIASRGWQGGDGNGLVITVRASRAALLKALTTAGFAPPTTGRRLSSAGEGDEDYMTVIAANGHASLDCS